MPIAYAPEGEVRVLAERSTVPGDEAQVVWLRVTADAGLAAGTCVCSLPDVGPAEVSLWVGKRVQAVRVMAPPPEDADPERAAPPGDATSERAVPPVDVTPKGAMSSGDGAFPQASAPAEAGAGTLRLAAATAAQLLLPTQVPLHLGLRMQSGTWRLGPVIGLLVGDGFGNAAENLVRWTAMELHRTAEPGLIYVFTMRDVVVHEASVQARLWANGGFGAPQPLPLPDVVRKRAEVNRAIQLHLRRICDDRLFNEWMSWGKGRVQEVLDGQPHVPAAVRLDLADGALAEDVHRLEDLVAAHGAAYLKPCYGSHGQGVFRLEREGQAWRLVGQAGGTGQAPSGSAGDAGVRIQDTPVEALRRYRDTVPTQWGYLAQQAIEPLVPDRPLDLRVVVQRGGDGRLGTTAICARVAAGGHAASNLQAGGRLAEPRIVGRVLGLSEDEIVALLDDVSLGCVTLVERLEAAVGRIGEAGLDVAIDPQRQWWVIEVNPRPDPTLFLGAGEGMFEAVTRTPLRYAAWLAGFSVEA